MTRKCTNVCSEVVANDLCVGCGVCAGNCHAEALEMRFNEFGEYIAVASDGKCSEKCRLCLQLCPFSKASMNEDGLGRDLFESVPGMKHLPATGYYLDSFAGYSKIDNHRVNGASGGVATWALEALLRRRELDYVACVSPVKDSDRIFKFTVCSTPEEVRSCSKSCYYPVETSQIVREILSKEGRYGIIGLPCVIKALRLAMLTSRKLRERIKLLFALVCGQNKGKFFAEYICSMAGGNPNGLTEAAFRVKDLNRKASDFGARVAWQDSENGDSNEAVVFWTEGMGLAWSKRYFTLNACDYCDDLFGEVADISFMDAWLPQYIVDSCGTSFVIVRNPQLVELLRDGAEATEIEMTPIDIRDVVTSQRGALAMKRQGVAARLALAKKLGRFVPKKRVFETVEISAMALLRAYAERRFLFKSKIAFREQKGAGPGLKVFHRRMFTCRLLMALIRKMERVSERAKRLSAWL